MDSKGYTYNTYKKPILIINWLIYILMFNLNNKLNMVTLILMAYILISFFTQLISYLTEV